MPALKASSTSAITALVSGSPEKARRLAAQYGVPVESIYSYEQFDRIRENASVDAVYIGLPNGMHAEYTIRAAQAGKHVLCEKPMAISVEESKAMTAACKRANRKLNRLSMSAGADDTAREADDSEWSAWKNSVHRKRQWI